MADSASDASLTAALAALKAVARRSVIARGLQGPAEQKLLQSIVDATVSLFDAEASSIALFERGPDRLEYRVAAGEHGAGAVGLSVGPSEGIAGFVFSTGQDYEKVRRDSERDYFLSAEEAKAYGVIDEVFAGNTESLISMSQAAAGTMPTADEAHQADAAGEPEPKKK